jgi:dGTPase
MKTGREFSFLRANEIHAKREYDTEKESANRSKFVRDRDRILFSKEFRRLEGKTQVFINGYDDHIRNRLTHTLEVSQISLSISNHFGFDSSLTEAIALGHDVGHTPFGHVGERILNHFTNNCLNINGYKIDNRSDRGFKHNWQGVKVVSTLEKISPLYPGLNLTDYTIWGILNHSDLEYKKCKRINGDKCQYYHNSQNCNVASQIFSLEHYSNFNRSINTNSWTFEGLIVGLADEIAQRHHDIEDGLIAGIIDRKELVDRFFDAFKDFLDDKQQAKLQKIKDTTNINFAVHDISSLIISFYSKQLIDSITNTLNVFLQRYNIKSVEEFYAFKDNSISDFEPHNEVKFSEVFNSCDGEFRKYLISRVLNSHLAQTMDGKASHILNIIIEAYLKNPKQLPDGTIVTLLSNYLPQTEFNDLTKDGSPQLVAGKCREKVDRLSNSSDNKFKTILIRTITDYIAGMTDNYAISQYKMLYGSDNFWMK